MLSLLKDLIIFIGICSSILFLFLSTKMKKKMITWLHLHLISDKKFRRTFLTFLTFLTFSTFLTFCIFGSFLISHFNNASDTINALFYFDQNIHFFDFIFYFDLIIHLFSKQFPNVFKQTKKKNLKSIFGKKCFPIISFAKIIFKLNNF